MTAQRLRESTPSVFITESLTDRVLVLMPDGELCSAVRVGPLAFADGNLLLYEIMEATRQPTGTAADV